MHRPSVPSVGLPAPQANLPSLRTPTRTITSLVGPRHPFFLALLIPPSWNRVGLFGGYNLPGSVDIRGVDFQSRTGINLNKGRYVVHYVPVSLPLLPLFTIAQ
jgi:hypothetical protein